MLLVCGLQGPGLCLYNDAVFTEEDWLGIRRLSDSIKKNNPLQVGQFGLGFKSVFHLTGNIDCYIWICFLQAWVDVQVKLTEYFLSVKLTDG